MIILLSFLISLIYLICMLIYHDDVKQNFDKYTNVYFYYWYTPIPLLFFAILIYIFIHSKKIYKLTNKNN